MIMEKTFNFDKVAYTSARCVNLPTVEMRLEYKNGDMKKPVLSICGELWNSKHTDIVMGGQCLDKFAQFDQVKSNPTFKKLYRLWKLYHMNDLNAGSRSQQDALVAEFGTIPSYDKACEYLKSIDLYEDENGYIYGTSWLYNEIPDNDLKEIMALFAE